jgi:hypothetical protein
MRRPFFLLAEPCPAGCCVCPRARCVRSAADDDDEPAPPSPLDRLKELAETGADAATLVRARRRRSAPRNATTRRFQKPGFFHALAPSRVLASLCAHARHSHASGAAPRATQAVVVADMEAALSAAHDRAAAAAAAAAETETALKAGKDALLRLNAEFQNFRNRTEREKTVRAAARPQAA